MSDKIKDKMGSSNSKKFVLKQQEFNYLISIDQVRQQFDFMLNQLQAGFMKLKSLEYGYKYEDNVQFSVNLNDETRELTIITLPPQPAPEAPATPTE